MTAINAVDEARLALLLGIVMIVFTFFGGMEAVIWVEVVQLAIYIGGAIAATATATS